MSRFPFGSFGPDSKYSVLRSGEMQARTSSRSLFTFAPSFTGALHGSDSFLRVETQRSLSLMSNGSTSVARLLEAGRVAQQGSLDDLRRSAATGFVSRFALALQSEYVGKGKDGSLAGE